MSFTRLHSHHTRVFPKRLMLDSMDFVSSEGVLMLSDQEVLQLVSGPAPATIADVIGLMEALDQGLATDDGLKWFNFLYLAVTKQVDAHPPAGGWSDQAWVTRLDVVFANLYFSAIASYLTGAASLPSAWGALFEARRSSGTDRLL